MGKSVGATERVTVGADESVGKRVGTGVSVGADESVGEDVGTEVGRVGIGVGIGEFVGK